MLPISAGLPLILSRKKRPKRRRLEPEPVSPPCGGSAPAGSASWAVADPALPSLCRSRQRAPPASPRATLRASGRTAFAERGWKEGPRPRATRPRAPALSLSASLRPAAAPSSPGKRCTGAAWAARPAGRAAGTSGVTAGRSVRGLCVPPRHVATPRALPPRALRAVRAALRLNKAETPRRKELCFEEA